MLPRTQPWRVVAGGVLATVLAGCGSGLGEKRGATSQGSDMGDLWRVSVMIALGVGALVVSLIVWCVLRYRRRGRDGIPSQRQYNVPLEITYTAVPIVIVLGLFVASWSVQNRVDALSSHPDVTIDVRGFQWQWQFGYHGEGITITGLPDRAPVMVVPVHRTIRFVLTSRDVIHSFYVPEFLFKRDVVPGLKNQFEITVDKVGLYKGYCAEFCGLDHSRMTFSVRAVSTSAYREWVSSEKEHG